MADVQLENGNFQIANGLADAFCKVNLSAYESRIVWAIIRKTYGWKKKSDRISYGQFEDLTGLKRRHIFRTIETLVNRNIVIRSGNGYKLFYGIQKDYDKWKSLPIQVTNQSKKIVTYSGNTPLPIQVTNSLPIQVMTKNNKNTIQKTKRENSGFQPISFYTDQFLKEIKNESF